MVVNGRIELINVYLNLWNLCTIKDEKYKKLEYWNHMELILEWKLLKQNILPLVKADQNSNFAGLSIDYAVNCLLWGVII